MAQSTVTNAMVWFSSILHQTRKIDAIAVVVGYRNTRFGHPKRRKMVAAPRIPPNATAQLHVSQYQAKNWSPLGAPNSPRHLPTPQQKHGVRMPQTYGQLKRLEIGSRTRKYGETDRTSKAPFPSAARRAFFIITPRYSQYH